MKLEISRKQLLTSDIHLFEFRDPSGGDLPKFAPGAHVTVGIPNGMKRTYSLCSDPQILCKYEIAVKRQADGRGGSISLVDETTIGDKIEIGDTNNSFKLTSVATEFLFVAGGIGITPILAMVRHVSNHTDIRWQLFYCTRHADQTAFRSDLTSFPIKNGKISFFHSDDEVPTIFEPWSAFEKPKKNCHVYCCGPAGLMEGVKDATGHWPLGSIHFENFGIEKPPVENRPFVVRLKSSGESFDIRADQSIIDVLRAHGYAIPSSCESGTCGTCRTRLLSGVAEHRDLVLQDNEKASQIIPCVSRAVTDTLELDL